MVAENDEMPLGWPLGLRFLNLRLRVMEPLNADSMEPNQFPSTSFSSFSSSDFDTESSASFFQDNSVSVAQLIGNGNRSGDQRAGHLYFPNSSSFEERKKRLAKGSSSDGSKVKQGRGESGVSCISILLDKLRKIRKSKKSSRS